MTVKGANLRTEQASATRRRIIEAAERVFVRSGYTAARVQDVAVEAGVAVPTVYKGFTNKKTLLIAAVAAAMAGEQNGGPIETQPWWQEQLAEQDPRRQLRLIARNARRIYERAGALLEVTRDAGRLDPDVAAVWADVNEQRMDRSRRTARVLVARSSSTMKPADVAFTLWALTGPELYASHVAAGRSPAKYEAWLGATLESTVLR